MGSDMSFRVLENICEEWCSCKTIKQGQGKCVQTSLRHFVHELPPPPTPKSTQPMSFCHPTNGKWFSGVPDIRPHLQQWDLLRMHAHTLRWKWKSLQQCHAEESAARLRRRKSDWNERQKMNTQRKLMFWFSSPDVSNVPHQLKQSRCAFIGAKLHKGSTLGSIKVANFSKTVDISHLSHLHLSSNVNLVSFTCQEPMCLQNSIPICGLVSWSVRAHPECFWLVEISPVKTFCVGKKLRPFCKMKVMNLKEPRATQYTGSHFVTTKVFCGNE